MIISAAAYDFGPPCKSTSSTARCMEIRERDPSPRPLYTLPDYNTANRNYFSVRSL